MLVVGEERQGRCLLVDEEGWGGDWGFDNGDRHEMGYCAYLERWKGSVYDSFLFFFIEQSITMALRALRDTHPQYLH